MNINTLLVDGNFLLKSSKHVLARNGHVGVIYSFLTSIRMILNMYNCNKVIVSWDGNNAGKMRYLIDKNYKANRPSKSWHKTTRYTQKEIDKMEREKKDEHYLKIRIQQYLEELFIRQIEVEQIESDDIIAFYCKEYSDSEKIIIFTNDRDYLQLVEYKNVKVYLQNIKKIIYKENFNEHFNYHYKNAKNIKILCGDASDNIKGIEGLQETTLHKFFPEHMKNPFMINDIIKKAKSIQKQRLAENKKPLKVLDKLIFSRDLLIRNNKLINLSNPMLSEEAINEIRNIHSSVLDINDRGSKNLLEYMREDLFLKQYSGQFIDYVKPFLTVIEREKRIFNNYMNKS